MNRKVRRFGRAEKELIVQHWKGGETFREIGELLGRTHSSIQRVIMSFKERDQASFTPKPRTGRPPKLTSAEKEDIIQTMQQNPYMPVSTLAQRIRENYNKCVSDDTVRNVLKKAVQKDSRSTSTQDMEAVYDECIKEEPLPMDYDYGNYLTLTTSNAPYDDVPIKNEPFFDDHAENLAKVENEPITDDSFLDTKVPAPSYVNPVPNAANNSIINGFVIYELEPPAYSNSCEQNNVATVVGSVPALSNIASPPPPRLLNGHTNARSNQVQISKTTSSLSTNKDVHSKEASTLTTSPNSVPLILNVKGNAKPKKILNKQQRNARPLSKPPCKSSIPETSKATTTPPPILLNSQLRKRSIVIGNSSAATNKKPCYNSDNVETMNVIVGPPNPATNLISAEISPSLKIAESLPIINNSANRTNGRKPLVNELESTTARAKKIINLYLKQKKNGERLKKMQQEQNEGRKNTMVNTKPSSNLELSSSTLETATTMTQDPTATVVKTEILDIDMDTNITNTTKPMETCGSSIKSLIAPSQQITIESNILPKILQRHEETIVKTEIMDDDPTISTLNTSNYNNLVSKDPLHFFPNYTTKTLTTPAINSNIQPPSEISKTTATPNNNSSCKFRTRPSVDSETQTSLDKPLSEIKVKCLCSLTNNMDKDDQSSSSNDENLERFFKRMFEETRCLSKQHQRAVKMSLLRAVCEAEEMVEMGKCCGF